MLKYIIEIDIKASARSSACELYAYAPHIYNTQQDAENAASAILADDPESIYLVSVYEAVLSRKDSQFTDAERVAVYRTPGTRSSLDSEAPAALAIYTRKTPNGERVLGVSSANYEYALTTGRIYQPQATASPAEPVQIGIGHLIHALQVTGWGHDEIMAMREALITRDFSGIAFCPDCYTADWDDAHRISAQHNRRCNHDN